MAAVTIHSDFIAQENKVFHCLCCFPIYLPWSDGTDEIILFFWMLNFKPAFSLSSFTFIKRLFGSSSLSLIRVRIWGYWYFSQQSWFQLVLHPVQHFAWCTLHISKINRVTIYSFDAFLSQFRTRLLLHVWF